MLKCVICSQVVTSKRGLSFHIKKHGFESLQEYLTKYPDEENKINPKDESLLTCPICGRYNMKQLGQHIVGTHKMTHDQFLKLYPDQVMFVPEISERCKRAQSEGIRQWKINKEEDPEKYHNIYQQRARRTLELHPDIPIRVSTKLKQNGYYDRLSIESKQRWKNEEYRKMQTNKCKKQHENGLTQIILEKSGRKRYPVTINNVTYNMRSTWEVAFAKLLNNMGFEFEYEPFALKYYYEGNIKYYYPDFVIKGTNIIFEVKPYELMCDIRNQIKQRTSIEKGYAFRYITKNEIDNPHTINFTGCY